MRRIFSTTALLVACGGGQTQEAQQPKHTADNPETPPDTNDVDPDAGPVSDPAQAKKDPCVGFEFDLTVALMQAACEIPNPKPDEKSVDTKGKLEVTLVSSSAQVAPGGHADLTLTLTNKSSSPLPLTFTLDPTPRFPSETYDSKNKRADLPAGKAPALPKGTAPREATSHDTARITLVPNGTAKTTIPWDALKTKWAPEKLKGTPPEMGYPRAPNGPLAKGTYTVRVAMPLMLVFEGTEREVSAPKTTLVVK